jgi:uncharacterized protein (DUF849 family)
MLAPAALAVRRRSIGRRLKPQFIKSRSENENNWWGGMILSAGCAEGGPCRGLFNGRGAGLRARSGIMNFEAFITCAVTGAGDTADKHPDLPVTPEQIAESAIEAGKAGARDPELFKQVVDRIRSSDTDVVLNLTAGMGGDLVFGSGDKPLPLNPDGTDIAPPLERLAHVEQLLPEICTLDCGTMNFAAGGDYVMVNTPSMLRTKAQRVRELGVRPELEVFDTGHLVFVKEMLRDGLLDDPVMVQLCMGIPYGAPDDGRMELPYVAMATMAGGNVRVGLEDNLYLERGVFATNAQLVERAVTILEAMGVRVLGPDEVRDKLHLTKRG